MAPDLILGIETSCDETAAAVVRDGRAALADVVSTQIDIHRRWGGVVPAPLCQAHGVFANWPAMAFGNAWRKTPMTWACFTASALPSMK